MTSTFFGILGSFLEDVFKSVTLFQHPYASFRPRMTSRGQVTKELAGHVVASELETGEALVAEGKLPEDAKEQRLGSARHRTTNSNKNNNCKASA